MSVDTAELENWFKGRPKWLQDAARRIFQAGNFTANDLNESLVLCKREAGMTVDGFEELRPLPITESLFRIAETAITLRLEAISEVKGINALAPRKALEFGNAQIVVVFGANGAGKSGYIRVLKHACGGRGAANLRGDVFAPVQQAKSCKIKYSQGAAMKDVEWTPEVGANPDLRTVALYDTNCAHVYVNNENEVTYEPPLLASFRTLVAVCESVEAKLAAEINAKVTSKPTLPPEYAVTTCGKWFNKISWQTKEADITAKCAWNETLDAELRSLSQRLAEANPAERARALRKTKGHLSDLSAILKANRAGLSDVSFKSLLEARATAKSKRQVAEVDAKKVFENPLLEGVSSESWRLLWEQARLYSESEAYKGTRFPNIEGQALCVLCQQPLSEAAKQRFISFEAFVRGGLESEASTAETVVKDIIAGKSELPTGKDLESKFDLAGVSDDAMRDMVRIYCADLSKRRSSFLAATAVEGLTEMPSEGAINLLSELEEKYEANAKVFDDDTKEDKKAELQLSICELNAQKWLSQQKAGVQAEVNRLNAIHLLDESKRLVNTTALSKKASSLADILVTEEFKKRFKRELDRLGAARIKVKIEKTRAPKGHVLHQIMLSGNMHAVPTNEILSEGEFRIVSLAAFLADVDSNDSSSPFIFDDPISSLDQDFEERTATRLAELAKTRQVIVFTHRLSLLAMIEDAAKKSAIQSRVVSVHSESWGTGEPNEPPLPAQKPKTALNSLIGQRLSKAKKVWSEEGSAPYQIEAKALCSDIRITIERLIENDLLADVVQRFRRPINTMGKIGKLAKIKQSDCTFLDEMMTKYSHFEHSQPSEAPVPLPLPDELEEDLKKLKVWLDEFSARPMPPL